MDWRLLGALRALHDRPLTAYALAIRAGLTAQDLTVVTRLLIREGLAERLSASHFRVTDHGQTRFLEALSQSSSPERQNVEQGDQQFGVAHHRILALLAVPRQGEDLAHMLACSKRKLDDLILDLAAAGFVQVADPDHPAFAVALRDSDIVLLGRAERTLLASIPDACCLCDAYFLEHGTTRGSRLSTIIQFLEAAGLLRRVGRCLSRRWYSLTPAGASHFQRGDGTPPGRRRPAKASKPKAV